MTKSIFTEDRHEKIVIAYCSQEHNFRLTVECFNGHQQTSINEVFLQHSPELILKNSVEDIKMHIMFISSPNQQSK